MYFMAVGIALVIENYTISGKVNYMALLVVWFMFLQIFYKNRLLGIVYGTGIGVSALYLLNTTLSEYSEFLATPTDSTSAFSISVGVSVISLAMSVLMIYKFATEKSGYKESVLTVTY